jgi:hypothetical protein
MKRRNANMKSAEVALEQYQLLEDQAVSDDKVVLDEKADGESPGTVVDDGADVNASAQMSRRWFLVSAGTTALAFAWGVGVGYVAWGRTKTEASSALSSAAVGPAATIIVTATPTPQPAQVEMPHSYDLPVAYGEIGPSLLDYGAFTYDGFAQVYAQAGQPLTAEQQAIIREGSDGQITISHANAYFLLNFFWALGLSNDNPILKAGPMMEYSKGQIERFASTGGWPLATRPVPELFASAPVIEIDEAQQARLEEAAAAVYRPCCDNPTIFPDCNHGMAMLGLLELMASQNASVDQMLEAAKYVNSFWFPGQAQEVGTYYLAQSSSDFTSIDAREMVSAESFSRRGFASVHQWLVENGKLEQQPQNGSSCGV